MEGESWRRGFYQKLGNCNSTIEWKVYSAMVASVRGVGIVQFYYRMEGYMFSTALLTTISRSSNSTIEWKGATPPTYIKIAAVMQFYYRMEGRISLEDMCGRGWEEAILL